MDSEMKFCHCRKRRPGRMMMTLIKCDGAPNLLSRIGVIFPDNPSLGAALLLFEGWRRAPRGSPGGANRHTQRFIGTHMKFILTLLMNTRRVRFPKSQGGASVASRIIGSGGIEPQRTTDRIHREWVAIVPTDYVFSYLSSNLLWLTVCPGDSSSLTKGGIAYIEEGPPNQMPLQVVLHDSGGGGTWLFIICLVKYWLRRGRMCYLGIGRNNGISSRVARLSFSYWNNIIGLIWAAIYLIIQLIAVLISCIIHCQES